MLLTSFCRVCLSCNKRTKIIANTELQTVFENLTSNPLISGDGRPERVCYLCHWLLQRCCKFVDLSRRSEQGLSELLHSGVDLNRHTLIINCPSIQNNSQTLSVCKTTVVSITKLEEGECAEVYIKQGPTIEVCVKDDTDFENTIKFEKTSAVELDTNTPSPANLGNSSMETKIEQELKSSEHSSVLSPKQIIEYKKPFKDSNVKKNASLTKGKKVVQKKNASNSKQIKKSKQIPSGVKAFACEFNNCTKTFTNKRNLIIHTKTHTGERPYSCHICPKSFVCKKILTRHLQIHTGEKPHACHFCPKRFIQKPHLQDHIRTHTGEKPYNCSICSKKFGNANNLRVHIRRHAGDMNEKLFSCNRCSKKFLSNYDLKLHYRFHSGERPFACDECPATFKLKYSLKVHIRTHTGETPYPCQMCDKAFSSSSTLKRHKQSHHSDGVLILPRQSYVCDKCSREYKNKQSLQKHLATHIDDDRYSKTNKFVTKSLFR